MIETVNVAELWDPRFLFVVGMAFVKFLDHLSEGMKA